MKHSTFSLILTCLILASCSVNSQEPSRWRGPSGEGLFESPGLLDEWPEDGPEILWTYEELGQGHSSPVIAGDFIYTSGMKDGEGHLFKFDMQGKLVYDKIYGPEYVESFYGTRGSPTVVGDKIYLVSGYGVLYCLEEADASPVWTKDMVLDYGGDTIRWGYCETPVIDGHVVYGTPGGPEYNVIALDRHDASLIWSSKGKGELSAYCTPMLFTHGGRKILTTHTAKSLLGIDAKSGMLLWSHPHVNRWEVHPNTPIYRDGGLFFFSGYGLGGGLLKLNEDGSKVSKAWSTTMDSRMGGAVLIDGHIYASGDNARAWRCIEWESGKDVWSDEEKIAKGVVIAADNKLFGYSDRGELGMMKVSTDSLTILGMTRVKLGSEQHWAHPSIHDGVLYLRHGKALIAYAIR